MLVWTKDLSVGIVEIDDQHKELFDHVNRLLKAINEENAAEETGRIFAFLDSYILTHFSNEQRYMDEYSMHGYEDESRHKSEHASFIISLREFRADLEAGSPSQQFVAEFAKWITNWWLTHIQHIDKGFGAFLRKVFPMLGR